MLDKETGAGQYQALPRNQANYEMSDMTPGVQAKPIDAPKLEFDKNHEIIEATPKNETLWEFLRSKEVPKKAVALAFFFMVAGFILFICGFIDDLEDWDPFDGFLFWASGLILFVPGFYFTAKVIQAYRAKDMNVRFNILREIPDM